MSGEEVRKVEITTAEVGEPDSTVKVLKFNSCLDDDQGSDDTTNIEDVRRSKDSAREK